jgi:hypothetical protein
MGQDNLKRTAETGQTGKVSLTGHPRPDREERPARENNIWKKINYKK